MDQSDWPFPERPLPWDLTSLPVPAEVRVYTLAEWRRLEQEGRRFATTICAEAI